MPSSPRQQKNESPRQKLDAVMDFLVEVTLSRGHLDISPAHVAWACLAALKGWESEDGEPTWNERRDRELARMQRFIDDLPTGRLDMTRDYIEAHLTLSQQAIANWDAVVAANFSAASIDAISFETVMLNVFSASSLFGFDYETNYASLLDSGHSQNTTVMTGTEASALLNSMVGLDQTKASVLTIAAAERVNQKRTELKLKPIDGSMHYVFSGSPGTGKTTVARYLGAILKDSGALSKGHLIEVGRSDLVGSYVGQTSNKTKEVLETAIGGVLFVDEAYSLADTDNGSYGQEALVEILRFMENHRSDVCVIFAGYTEEMGFLIDSNPGLRSRFSTFVEFPDYTKDELFVMFERLAADHGFELDTKTKKAVRDYLSASDTSGVGGNGRFVRNLFERMNRIMSSRAVKDSKILKSEIINFTVDDVPPIDHPHSSVTTGFSPNEKIGRASTRNS